jgi:hypothetical protein
MNYIRHLNAFFSFIRSDKRLTSSHVSLYMALFHYWNFNRFNNPFSIYRDNIMQLSKLSKNTYHKCIKELHEAKYIYYHPSPSKFQAVRISVIRLDKEEPPPTRYKQPDLFLSPHLLQGDLGGGSGHKIETSSVANLSQTSPNIKTDTVANLGHIYKPNFNKQRETPTHEVFKRNDKIQNAINDFTAGGKFPSPKGEGGRHRRTDEADMVAGVPNPGHIPSLQEVQSFFEERKYSDAEAIKFFNHYQALHWKLQGITPILDWKPLVEKWMQNAKKWDISPSGGGRGRSDSEKDLQYLYDSYLDGKNIFQYLLPEHFDQLKLELNDDLMQYARQKRINQVSGTNQHSLTELWKAYLSGDPNNELVLKDKPILIALAKKLAVINHFHKLKNQSS